MHACEKFTCAKERSIRAISGAIRAIWMLCPPFENIPVRLCPTPSPSPSPNPDPDPYPDPNPNPIPNPNTNTFPNPNFKLNPNLNPTSLNVGASTLNLILTLS